MTSPSRRFGSYSRPKHSLAWGECRSGIGGVSFGLLTCLAVGLLFVANSLFATPEGAQNSQPLSSSDVHSSVAGAEDLADQLVESLVLRTEGGKPKIAVLEFLSLSGDVTNGGRLIAEELTTNLFRTQRFEVVERLLLNQILKEHKLQTSDIVDPETVKEIGRILGVEAIVTGTCTETIQGLRVNARVISAETGAVLAAASSTVSSDVSPPALPIPDTVFAFDGKGGRYPLTVKLEAVRRKPGSIEADLMIDNESETTLGVAIYQAHEMIPNTQTDVYALIDGAGVSFPLATWRGTVEGYAFLYQRQSCLVVPPLTGARFTLVFNGSPRGGEISLVHTRGSRGVGMADCAEITVALPDFSAKGVLPPA